MNEQKLKPLEILETQSGYKISKYVKQIELIELDNPEVSIFKKILKHMVFKANPCYDNLTVLQKRLLHTIAPIWANILQHGMNGKMIVTDDQGNRYNLDSISPSHCLVGEVNGFGRTHCNTCHDYNMGFASINSRYMRNSWQLDYPNEISGFLDHYYDSHWLKNE